MTLLLSTQFKVIVEAFAWLHLLLFIFFASRNMKFGSAQRYTIRNKTISKDDERSKIGFTNIITAHLRQAHIVLAQLAISVLLIRTDVGHDVLDMLAAKFNAFPGFRNLGSGCIFCLWRVFDALLIVGSVFFYSTAIWLIPWHLKAPNARAKQFQNKTMLVLLRALAMFTYLIIVLALLASTYYDESEEYVVYIFQGLWFCYALYWATKALDEYNKTAYADRLLIGLIGSIYLLCITRFWLIDDNAKLTLTLITGALSAVFWGLTRKRKNWDSGGKHRYPVIGNGIQGIRARLVWLDKKINRVLMRRNKLSPEPKPTAPYEALGGEGWWIQHNRIVYRILFVSGWFLALLLSFFGDIQLLSPFVIIFSGIGFIFMFIGNVFLTGRRLFNGNDIRKELEAPEEASRWQKFVIHLHNHTLPYFIVFVFAALYLLINSHNGLSPIRLVEKTKKIPAQLSLDAYLNRYLEAREADILRDSMTYPVFIFAGQGGGSRAGYWTSAALIGLEESTPTLSIREHTLAISAVSGSAPGTVAALQWWARPGLDSDMYTKEIYGRNFVTSGLGGILYSDIIKRFWPMPFSRYFMGRNERLSIEESAALKDAYLKARDDSDKVILEKFGDMPISEFYLDEKNAWRSDFPLFFPNATHVQSGRRAVVSPVIKPSIFLNSVSVIRDVRLNVEEQNSALSLIQAADLSQYFPYISAAGNIVGSENMYVDGGYFENYGLTTAHELYDACMAWRDAQVDSSLAHALDFYIIATINSDLPEGRDDLDYQCISQLLAPINTAYATRFSGHSVHKLKEVEQALADKFQQITFRGDGIPLTRVLTPANMLNMDSFLNQEIARIVPWMEAQVQPWNRDNK